MYAENMYNKADKNRSGGAQWLCVSSMVKLTEGEQERKWTILVKDRYSLGFIQKYFSTAPE